MHARTIQENDDGHILEMCKHKWDEWESTFSEIPGEVQLGMTKSQTNGITFSLDSFPLR